MFKFTRALIHTLFIQNFLKIGSLHQAHTQRFRESVALQQASHPSATTIGPTAAAAAYARTASSAAASSSHGYGYAQPDHQAA